MNFLKIRIKTIYIFFRSLYYLFILLGNCFVYSETEIYINYQIYFLPDSKNIFLLLVILLLDSPVYSFEVFLLDKVDKTDTQYGLMEQVRIPVGNLIQQRLKELSMSLGMDVPAEPPSDSAATNLGNTPSSILWNNSIYMFA